MKSSLGIILLASTELRRREHVDEQHRRVIPQQSLLGGLAPHHARGEHDVEAGEVPPVRVGVERLEHGAGERVAHDRDAVHTFPLDGVEQLRDVEATVRQRDNRATQAEDAERRERTRAVHQRTGGQGDGTRPREPLPNRFEVGILGVVHGRLAQEPVEVVLAPHDALGHPRRAARVQHVDVVARAPPRWECAGAAPVAGRIFVRHRPGRAWPRAVVDPEPEPHVRHAVANRRDAVRERAVEHHRDGIGVVPEVGELVLGVAVVGVHRDQTRFEAREHRLDVLVRVVEILRDLVLLRGARRDQRPRHAVRSAVELRPREPVVTVRERGRVGQRVGNRLPHVREVPAGHRAERTVLV